MAQATWCHTNSAIGIHGIFTAPRGKEFVDSNMSCGADLIYLPRLTLRLHLMGLASVDVVALTESATLRQ